MRLRTAVILGSVFVSAALGIMWHDVHPTSFWQFVGGARAMAQVQPTPLSTSSLCFDPAYPRLVLQSGTGPRHLVLPQGQGMTYSMPLSALPAESTWRVSTTTPWLSVASVPTVGPGVVPITVVHTLPVGRYEGSVDVMITGLYRDAQNNLISTVVPLPVSLDVIPVGRSIQVAAPSQTKVTSRTRATVAKTAIVTVDPGVQVQVGGVDCMAAAGSSKTCTVP